MQIYARAALIAITAFIVVVYYAPLGHVDAFEHWGDATFGIVLQPQHFTVDSIAEGSPAAKAGIFEGDEIVSPHDLEGNARLRGPYPGDTQRIIVEHDGVRRSVTLVAREVPGFGFWQRASGFLAMLPPTIFLIVAFLLAFARPSVMAWSLYIFAVGYFGTSPSFEFWSHLLAPQLFAILSFVLVVIFGSWSVLPLIPFVLRFPDGGVEGWRARIDPFVWAFLAVAFVAYAIEWSGYATMGTRPAWGWALEDYVPLAAFAFAGLVVVKNYAVALPADRQRWSFVAIGLIASFVAYAIYFVPGVSFEVSLGVGFAVVIMPICIAYSIFRLRVIDVTFVLNRTLVYGAISVGVIAFVSILDWLLARVVSERRLAVGIELLVTIGVGFLLDRINRAVEQFVEWLFFRKRRTSEAYLRRAAAALPYATDETAIGDGLAQIPVDALGLAGAALYRRSSDGKRFEGLCTSRETTIAPPGFDTNHLLVRMLRSSEEPVWLDELRANLDADNAAIYTLAVPVTVRHELASFTLYGAHTNGAQLDPEEVDLLLELAREASRAYDHVEAVRTRELYGALIEAKPKTA